MNRTELVVAAAGLALLLCATAFLARGHDSVAEVALNGGAACPAVPTSVIEPPGGNARGAVLIFHGLGANRVVMLATGRPFAAAGFRVYVPDMPGHGSNPAPFSFAASEACARGLVSRHLSSAAGEAIPLILVGHSMGGGLAIRLADDSAAAATIAIATGPIVRPHRLPPNLLLVAPQFDMPPILDMERTLAEAAGAERTSAEDFRQRRAFRLLPVPWRTHTSVVFDGGAVDAMVRWALNSAGDSNVATKPPDFSMLYAGLIGLLGIILMFPAAATATARLAGFPAQPVISEPARPRALAFLVWTSAVLLATVVVITTGIVPLRGLHIAGSDYVASLLLLAAFLAAVPLALILRRQQSQNAPADTRLLSALFCSAAVALALVLAAGSWLNAHVTEVFPTPSRWLRFPFLVLALLPACLIEEWILGPPGPLSRLGNWPRLAVFVVLRTIVWLAIFAAWSAGSDAALLSVLFVAFLAALSFAQRVGADALRRRTGVLAAGALFSAILAAWFLAAVFPLA